MTAQAIPQDSSIETASASVGHRRAPMVSLTIVSERRHEPLPFGERLFPGAGIDEFPIVRELVGKPHRGKQVFDDRAAASLRACSCSRTAATRAAVRGSGHLR